MRDEPYNIGLCLADVETLEKKQLSQGDLVDLDAVDVLEACFFTALCLRFLKLLLDRDDSVLFGAFEKNVVLWVNFQEVYGLQRVDHSFVSLRVSDDSLGLRTESKDIDTCLGQRDEVLIVRQNQALNLTLPELERLVPEQC